MRAALRILEAIGELNEGVPGLSLQVRIGINTGEAFVAVGAKPKEGEGIVTGDVVNTARQLGAMLRTALAAGDLDLAQRLADGIEPLPAQRTRSVRRPRPARRARRRPRRCRGALRRGSRRWQQFGNARERAYPPLGQGRCLVALGDPAAEAPLAEARELFSSMGYKPALAETEGLLERATAAAS